MGRWVGGGKLQVAKEREMKWKEREKAQKQKPEEAEAKKRAREKERQQKIAKLEKIVKAGNVAKEKLRHMQ